MLLAAHCASAAAFPPLPLARPGSTAPTPLPEAPRQKVEAQFTIYLGGFLFAVGNFTADFTDDTYRLNTLLTTAGLPRAFYEAEFRLSSEGRLESGRVRPDRYVSNSREKSSARKITLDYDSDAMPHMTAVPPYEPGDLVDVAPYQQIGTQDPVSAALVPVAGEASPCDRTIPVFDGRRRYDLKLTYDSEKKMTPRGLSSPRKVIVCNVRYVPVAPIEKRKFTEMLSRNDSIKVWFAPFDGGRVYLPVRLQLRTPLGGAVMELTHLSESTNAPGATGGQ